MRRLSSAGGEKTKKSATKQKKSGRVKNITRESGTREREVEEEEEEERRKRRVIRGEKEDFLFPFVRRTRIIDAPAALSLFIFIVRPASTCRCVSFC